MCFHGFGIIVYGGVHREFSINFYYGRFRKRTARRIRTCVDPAAIEIDAEIVFIATTLVDEQVKSISGDFSAYLAEFRNSLIDISYTNSLSTIDHPIKKRE